MVQPDEQAIEEVHREILERVEEGDLDEMGAQQEMQRAQVKLIGEAFGDVADAVEASDDVEFIENHPEFGFGIVDGGAVAILSLLTIDGVGGLVNPSVFG